MADWPVSIERMLNSKGVLSMKNIKILVFVIGLLVLVSLTGCAGDDQNGAAALEASGTISAESINVSPEVGGTVSEVLVSEGETVQAGDLLFTIDNEVYLAQKNQAEASVTAAEATVDAANAQLASAKIQVELALQGARFDEMENRNSAWFVPAPDEVETPEWYFTKDDSIAALETVIENAKENLDSRLANLDDVLADVSNSDFVAVEAELASAESAYAIAVRAFEIAQAAQSNDDLVDVAEEERDLALAELENAQQEYNSLLSTSTAQEVLETRAQVAIAQYLYDQAQDQILFLMSGDQSLTVAAAEAGVKQAETAVSQAEANLAQAQAALALVDIQIEKTSVYAPRAGVILLQNLEAGELVGAGGVVMRLGDLDTVNLVVYVSEDRYGEIKLNQEVVVQVDSFTEKSYTGMVTYISDEAEYTPSNVQTAEGRKATVFAIEITISNSNHDLKPGMPADVTFLSE